MLMNKPFNSVLLVLGISSLVMYEFWSKYGEKTKLCYIYTESL